MSDEFNLFLTLKNNYIITERDDNIRATEIIQIIREIRPVSTKIRSNYTTWTVAKALNVTFFGGSALQVLTTDLFAPSWPFIFSTGFKLATSP